MARVDLTDGQYEFAGTRNQVIAASELTMAAAHAGSGHPLDAEQQVVLDQARHELGDDYVDAVISHFDPGVPDQAIPTAHPHDLADFANNIQDSHVMEVSEGRADDVEAYLPDGLYEG